MSALTDNIGFIQSLFNGKVLSDYIHSFSKISDEELEDLSVITDAVKKFASETIDPVKIDIDHKIDDSVFSAMRNLGLFGLIIPEKYGGYESSNMIHNKVMEIIQGKCSSTAVMLGGHTSIGLKAILLFGTDEQKQKYLPDLASGKKLAAFALTEPDAGSDAANIRTTAVLSEDNKFYLLNGRKQWITNGGIADIFTIFAGITGDNGKRMPTAFIATKDMKGFSIGKEEEKLGIRGSSTTALFLQDVKVPVENVLGKVGGGFKVAMEVLNTGRVGLSAGMVGSAKSIISEALKFALQREQFGKKISEFGLIQEKFSDALINTFTTESIVYFTTILDEKQHASIALESAVCKVFASEKLWKTVNDCLQVTGGNGYMRDYPFERYLRDSRINMIFEGTNEILRIFIARSLIKSVSNRFENFVMSNSYSSGDLDGQIEKYYQEMIQQEEGFEISGISAKLTDNCKKLERLTKKVYVDIAIHIVRSGKEIKESQFDQKIIADIVIDLYGIYANLAREEYQIKCNDKIDDVTFVLERFFDKAEDRIIRNLSLLGKQTGKSFERTAKLLYKSGKYPFDILN